MIDLSFLTEEEQECILAVLRRDAELKKAEEKRVQNLQRVIGDKDQLKYMTGEWFYETKQLRHHERIHGADIIRASMRHTQKPPTLLELSHTRQERPSFVSSKNKEVFVPPVLQGVLQDPHIELSDDTYEIMSLSQDVENEPVLASLSPTKERRNPFNSEDAADFAFEEEFEVVDQSAMLAEDLLPSIDSCIDPISDLKQDPNDSQFTQNTPVPLSEPSTDSTTEESFTETDDPADAQTPSAAPRSILKHLSPSSSPDSLFPRPDPPSLFSTESLSDTWIDRKQVRFSSMVGRTGVDRQDGKELGEHSLLDVDFMAASEEGCDSDITGSTDMETHSTYYISHEEEVDPRPESGFQEEEVDPRPEPGVQEEEVDPRPEPGVQEEEVDQQYIHDDVSGQKSLELLSPDGLHFTAQESEPEPVLSETGPEESADSQEATTDRSTVPAGSTFTCESSEPGLKTLQERHGHESAEEETKQEEQDESVIQVTSQSDEDTVDNHGSVEQQRKVSDPAEVRTVQLTAMQNTPFRETVIPVETDSVVQRPNKLSNLKSFWERDNSASKIILSGEKDEDKDMKKTETEAAICSQTNSEAQSTNRKIIPEMKDDCSLIVVLSEEDGTYRANPVLIYEETEDILTSVIRETGSVQAPEITLPPLQEKTPDLAPPQLSPSPQEEPRAKISDLKNFWEKEVIKSRETAANAPSRSFRTRAVSPPSVRTFSYKERSEAERQTSPSRDKPQPIPRSINVSEKGFVTQTGEKTLLRSPEKVSSTCHQNRVQAESEVQSRPLSPLRRAPSPRARDLDDDTRRSPSKTCHPRVLPRETSGPKSPTVEGSPLKTFPIDINLQTKTPEEQRKPTPALRERKSPLHEAKQAGQTETKSSSDSVVSDVHTQQSTPNSPSPQHRKSPEKKLGTLTRLARSIISQDYQHYLGPQERAHVPPFTLESDAPHSPQKTLRNSVGILKNSPTKGSPVREKDGDLSQDISTRAWSLPRPTSGSYDEAPRPLMTSLRELSSKIKSSSKSLENLASKTRKSKNQENLREQTNQSVEDVSTLPSSSEWRQLKASSSVPLLQQDETDSDSTLDTNLGLRRNTGSSTSNLSLSSGLASMSSVSGSISSIYPADFGDIEVQGTVQFAMNYIQKLGEFHIFVVHCRDLAVADAKKNRSDPYVKCYLLPDKTKLGKRKTAVKKKTLNPDYNEILRFKVPMEMLKTQSLNISVWHNDTFGRNSFLGDVDVDLSEWDFSNTHINEYALKAGVSAQTSAPTPPQLTDSRGQMRVALRFLPQTANSQSSVKMETSEVQIWVKDCKNLPSVRGVVIDPFVKCAVLPDTSRKSKQKTRVVKRTANPMFNHTMVYDGFKPDDLKEACVEITVWDHDRLNNHYIGGVRLGLGTGKSYGVDVGWMDSTPDEASLWQRMLQADGEWVEDVLPLRMLVMAKSKSK